MNASSVVVVVFQEERRKRKIRGTKRKGDGWMDAWKGVGRELSRCGIGHSRSPEVDDELHFSELR